MGKLTLQINSLEALERLIGGDSEIEIDIRQSVLENFSRKHIKSLATTDAISHATIGLKNEILKEVTRVVKKGYDTQVFLSDEVIKAIGLTMDGIISAQLQPFIVDLLEKRKIKDYLAKEVERQAEYIKNELTSKTIEAKLNLMVDAKIREKLGIK